MTGLELTPSFPGLTDPAYLFPVHGVGGHSAGMGLDLGIGQQFVLDRFQEPAFDQAPPQNTGTGWSLQNAKNWADSLPLTPGNNQAGALRNFLSLYALTISDGNAANQNGSWEELPIVNGERVRVALFGSGTQNDRQLVQNVWIGGDKIAQGVTTPKTKFRAIRSVLDRLGFAGNGLHNGAFASHYNHFHLDIRAPQIEPLPSNLLVQESPDMVHADTGIGVSSMSDANTIQQEIDEEIHMLAHDLLEYP